MAETYFDLSARDRREALTVAANASGRPVHLLEKDIWVVWCLETLFGNEIGAPLVFKGGTSLSKAYRVIRRLSEDVDLTYDMVEDGLLMDEAHSFDEMMAACADLEAKARGSVAG
ncbi:nucleotidyl transferase AbiEii/AbiGii toxin family protein [Marinovum sp.]|uniref:nucleotidyl transferase AbiEii/AbiGii toxin family protein n=1 Tax=Marinovum sp. TaxID=2024839 RepID=UPI002B2790E9|nr:nucleotidyl transferase AbiEii/AbiGii toxin family protein [Marinovum sp.]